MNRWTKGDISIAVLGNALAIVLVFWDGTPLRPVLLAFSGIFGLLAQAVVPMVISAAMTVYFLKRRLRLRRPVWAG